MFAGMQRLLPVSQSNLVSASLKLLIKEDNNEIRYERQSLSPEAAYSAWKITSNSSTLAVVKMMS